MYLKNLTTIGLSRMETKLNGIENSQIKQIRFLTSIVTALKTLLQTNHSTNHYYTGLRYLKYESRSIINLPSMLI